MKKRIVGIILIFALCLTSCGVGAKLKPLEDEAKSIIEWYKGYCGLSADSDLSELDADALDYLGREAVNPDNLAVLCAAKYFSVPFNEEKYYNKLVDVFKNVYKSEQDIQNAYLPSICKIALFLKSIDKDPADFCGYDLSGIIISYPLEYADIFTLVFALDAVRAFSEREDSQKVCDELLQKIIALQDGLGGWGYTDYFSGEYSTDSDTTAMVLGAIGKANCDRAVLSSGLSALSGFKNEDGTFKSAYSDSSSSTTAIALRAINLIEPEQFSGNKSGLNVLSVIGSFKNEDGGYRAGVEAAPSDTFSSLDVLQTLMSVHKVFKGIGQ